MQAGGKILDMQRQGTLASVCAMLLWMGGCPKRQERQSVLVYVPATPAAATSAKPDAGKPEVLVIEEPSPPPETQTESKEPPATNGGGSKVIHHRQGPAHAAAPAEPDEDAPEDTPTPPPTAVPALEPRESSSQEAELRQQYQKLAEDVRQRMERLNRSQLSSNDRRTLEDARSFFVQSSHASNSGDLPRALNLARKASLLLAALE